MGPNYIRPLLETTDNKHYSSTNRQHPAILNG